VDGDPPAHADDHRLAVHRFEALLEMVDEILRDEPNPFVGADEHFERRPLRLEPLLLLASMKSYWLRPLPARRPSSSPARRLPRSAMA
jgi:hypothetical protein